MLRLWKKLVYEWQLYWWKRDRARMKRELQLSLPNRRKVWPSRNERESTT